VNLAISSKRILQYTNFAQVVEMRRRNYQWVGDAIQKVVGVASLHPALAENTCPLVFPVAVHSAVPVQPILRDRGTPPQLVTGVIHRSISLEKSP